MSDKSTIYFTSKGVVQPPPPESSETPPKRRSLSDAVYDYRSYASDASQASREFAAKSKEWEDEVAKWKLQSPDEATRKRVSDSAKAGYDFLEKSKKQSEDYQSALASRMKTLPKVIDDSKEIENVKTLEDLQITFRVACESMNQSLPQARRSLESLLGFGDQSMRTAVQRIFGRTPHVPPESRSPKVTKKPDTEAPRKKPEKKATDPTLSSFMEDDYYIKPGQAPVEDPAPLEEPVDSLEIIEMKDVETNS